MPGELLLEQRGETTVVASSPLCPERALGQEYWGGDAQGDSCRAPWSPTGWERVLGET